MLFFSPIILRAGALCFCLLFITASYADTVHDVQSWFNTTVTGSFDKKSTDFSRFKYWLEGQERLGEDSTRMSQALGRIGLGYTITANTSLWLGYAWVHTGIPFTTNPFDEERIWQQLLWSKKYASLSLVSRTRMEQRFLATTSKTAYRIRQLFKCTIPIDSRLHLSVVGSNELFWHKNNFIGQNGQGFDQNRAFIGFGYPFSPEVHTEIGYMNQYIRRFDVPNFFNNILSVNLYLNF